MSRSSVARRFGVDPARLGDRVTALVDPDAFADFALADAAWLAPVPQGLQPGPASLLTVAAPVALRLLRTGRLAEGESVLVHSGAGNIGALTIQLAKMLGAGTVIATASTTEKLEYTRALGADVAVDYTAEGWPDRARDEMTEVARYLSEDRLRTRVRATLPLTEAAEAHRLLEDRSATGRILLTP